MAQGDLEVVRRFYDAYNARDAAAWSSLIADEFQFQSAFVGVEGRVYEGPGGFSATSPISTRRGNTSGLSYRMSAKPARIACWD